MESRLTELVTYAPVAAEFSELPPASFIVVRGAN